MGSIGTPIRDVQMAVLDWSCRLPKGPTGKILKREIDVPAGERV